MIGLHTVQLQMIICNKLMYTAMTEEGGGTVTQSEDCLTSTWTATSLTVVNVTWYRADRGYIV